MKEKNYTKDGQGLSKLRTLLKGPKTVLMATALEKIPFSVCPMTIQQMDEQGDLWMFTTRDSDNFSQIENDNRIQILYGDELNQKYISLFGNATHIVDLPKVDELWNDSLNKWFDGQGDPNLVLLNINIESAYYWENGIEVPLSSMRHGDENFASETPGKKGHIDLQNH
ncbi:pyridoxamine 5'-phosphate oxidase family protein [Arenibacter sp. M-2]|uniref:pyridoxamine 5'-phosphate oxidase family protein n=1 Tax=Arenibacter TaxID=178469 RepID=UPI001C06702B|nr:MULTISPECIES: pyridoxamine 5'-phosphate oxidase family protein [Arenibacter]MBU2905914.1 pyridoxamine 5'-phosphate oxidase family protein [Arenibacter algicola]MDL5515087.1 pyridoxamine 5'-phosphate oxidase family protein [Arenibacter sp. M-2]